MTTVSVVIPAYNAEAHLARAIISVLVQTRKADEILVINDGSTDGTWGVVEAFGDRVRGMNRPHLGAAAARNAGIEASNGELVAFLDADDEWLPEKLARQLEIHQAADIVMSYCRSNEYDPEGRDLGDTFRQGQPRRGPEIWRGLLAENFIPPPRVWASRVHLRACGGFDERLKVGEDQDMWIRLALRGRVDFVDRSLVRVHMREGSLSSSGFQDQVRFTLEMIERHLQGLAAVLDGEALDAIRARRLGQVGRNAYAHGEWWLGLQLMARAIWLGDEPVRNLYHLLAAAAAMRQRKKASIDRLHTMPAISVDRRPGFGAS
jgi:glycosyltransferase involved in cell wall biosynthesis